MRRRRKRHAGRREHRTETREAFVQISAHQELLGGLALQLRTFGGVGSLRRRQIRLRRFDHAAAVGEGVAELHPHAMTSGALARLEIEREPVQAGRAFEGEGGSGLLGRRERVVRRLVRGAGAAEVDGQRLRIRASR